ncbi:MAG: glycosyltransferase family 39 protein [Elusimicrobiota bacterium]|nr:glycosyltransferase family 39 protein [Elusimicrobiota bacterium]
MASAERCEPCEDGRRLLAAALLVRVVWAVLKGQFWGYHDDGLFDDGAYIKMGRALLGDGPLSMTHPPGYAAFLAPFLALGEWGVSLARWAQFVVSALIPVLAYRLALALNRTRAEALAAGVFLVFDPMLVYFTSRIMSEASFTALAAAFLLAWLHAWRSGSVKAAALAGALGAAASLTRGVMLPYGGLLALVALLRRKEQPAWARLVLACGVVWTLGVGAWTARNWRAYGRFVPISVQGGWNFYEGLATDYGEIAVRPVRMGEEAKALGLTTPFELDAHFGAKAKAFIRESPGEFVRICAVKAARFWRLAPEAPHALSTRLAAGAFSAVFFGFALYGLTLGAARAPGAWFLIAWCLHLNLLHAVFAASLRYRLPVLPAVAVFAGAGLAAFIAQRGRIGK